MLNLKYIPEDIFLIEKVDSFARAYHTVNINAGRRGQDIELRVGVMQNSFLHQHSFFLKVGF